MWQGHPPVARAAAVCADYDTQREAQEAADTIDADNDGIYCETLPCPCLRPGSGDDGDDGAAPPPTEPTRTRRRGQ